MRSPAILLILLSLITGFISCKSPANKTDATPNIIYIYADDLGYGELGSYGQTKIKTPHLDRMAAEGIRFTQHYTSTPVCAPARAMLLTGLHGGHSFIRGNHELGGFADTAERGQYPLPKAAVTIADILKTKGYSTAIIGKWGLGMANTEGNPQLHGFDYSYGYLDQKQAHNYYPSHLWENGKWDTLDQPYFYVHRKLSPDSATDAAFASFIGKDYAPDKMTEKAEKFIREKKSRPFFLYLPYTIPHASLQVPEKWVNTYKGQFEEQPYYGQQGYTPSKYPLSTYAGMISYLDEQVGKIMDLIKELGLEENTLICFSSDNGATFNGGVDARFFNSAAGMRGLKMDLYEGGIRMPFIARWPGKIEAGTVSDHVSVQYDLMATLAELTGTKAPPNDGISFLPTLLGKEKEQQPHEFLYFEYPENGGQRAIRYGNWKAVKTGLKKNPSAPWQLFDLSKDPAETTDLANQHAEMLQRFDAIVTRERQDSPLTSWNF
jgi:arylsulfatase A-like enzyme